MKTFTIKAMKSAAGRTIEFWLTRHGKRHAGCSVQGLDDVTPVWKLRRKADELGATHVRLDWTGWKSSLDYDEAKKQAT